MGDCFGVGTNSDDRLAPECFGCQHDRINVSLPVEVRLHADQTNHISMSEVALEDELICRPNDLANVVVDPHLRALLGEVVKRVGVDRAHGYRVVRVDEGGNRLGRRASDVEPPFEPNQHHWPIERADAASAKIEHIGGLHHRESASV